MELEAAEKIIKILEPLHGEERFRVLHIVRVLLRIENWDWR